MGDVLLYSFAIDALSATSALKSPLGRINAQERKNSILQAEVERPNLELAAAMKMNCINSSKPSSYDIVITSVMLCSQALNPHGIIRPSL